MDEMSPVDSGYCESCKHSHGELYICHSYSEEKKKAIEEKTKVFHKNLNDPEWRQKQIDRGIPERDVDLFRALYALGLMQ